MRRASPFWTAIVALLVVVLASFVTSLVDGCSPPPPACPGADWPDDPKTDEARLDACTRAGAKLKALGCKEARPDFAEVCKYLTAQGVPLHPQCLATITTCAEVESKCNR